MQFFQTEFMRNKNLAAVFAMFLGSFGVHRFYLGQVGLGIVYILFFWTSIPLFLGIIDALVFFGMSQEEFDHKYNKIKGSSRGKRRPDYANKRFEQEADKESPTPRTRPTTINRPRPTRRSSTIRKDNSALKRSGIKKFKEFDYQGAIEDFEEALKVNDRDIAIHFNIACAYSLMEQKKKAFFHVHKAVDLGFNDFEKIQSHDSLAFMRIQPEYLEFKDSEFKILPEWEDKEKVAKEEETKTLDAAPDNDLLEELRRLENLKDLGVLTEAEFVEQKNKLENPR